jgi:O-antigen/teichoic acid export membrane protein
LDFIKKITQTNLFKITSLNSFSVLLKLGTGLITSKLIAVFVGPSGMALMGNLRNFISSVEGVSTLGFQNGIVKYISENENNKKVLKKIISTLLISFLIVAFFLSILIFIFSDYFCYKIFGNNFRYSIVLNVVALVLPWNAISILFLSILNGLGKYNKVIYANIIANVLCVLLSFVLIFYFRTIGAFFSVVFVPVILVFVTSFYLPEEIKSFIRIKFYEFDFKILKNFSSFSLMVLPPTILSPIFKLKTRIFLIDNVGLDQAGFWEAITKISNLYLLFVSTIVSVYFYPQLIKANGIAETKKIILSFYKFILPVFILGMFLIYFSRIIIVKILFTDEFFPVSELFFWQLTADVFGICGLILGFLLIAQKRTFHYIIIEVLAILFLYFASLFFIKTFGVQGALIAQCLETLLYLIVLMVYFRKYLF